MIKDKKRGIFPSEKRGNIKFPTLFPSEKRGNIKFPTLFPSEKRGIFPSEKRGNKKFPTLFPSEKRGNILTEDIIFIVLNLIFFVIIILFISSKMSTAAILEEKYSKQIALLIDSAEPGMRIEIDMSEGIEKLENNWDKDKIVNLNENIVTIKLKEEGGYSYSFFNNVEISDLSHFDEKENKFILIIDRYYEQKSG